MKRLYLILCLGCAFASTAMAKKADETKENNIVAGPVVESAEKQKPENQEPADKDSSTQSAEKQEPAKEEPAKEAFVDEELDDDQPQLNAPITGTVSSLADALAAAYANNPELLQVRRDLLSKHEEFAQAWADYLPTITSGVSVTGSKQVNSGSDKDLNIAGASGTNTSKRSGFVSINQNLFAGGSTMAAVESAKKSIRGLWSDLLSNEQKTFFNVIKAYLDLINKLSKVDVYKTNYAAVKKNYDTAYEKHSIGEEPLTQVANAEAKLAQAESDLRTAEAEVIGAKATLAAQTGVDIINIKKPDAPENLPQTLEKAIVLALENNPDVIKAQYDFVASKAEIDKANGKLLPTVDLQASTNRDEASNKYVNPLFPNVRKDSINTTNNVVKVEMKMDLYAGGRFSSKKRQAHEASVAKRLKIEAVKTELTGAVKSVYESYHAAKTNIENFKKQVKAAEVALEATRQEMDVGTKVLLDVLNAQKELVEAQLRLIDAEKNFFQFAFQMVSFLGGLHAKAMKLSVNYFDPATHFNRMPVGF